eukprot:CAMPEP_0119540474 /NCGR_PEP_ID=MMETSP1344-20130328/52356_1 /TAXON_ID=236787 /ORGANISM="Florenciella parvula, Strain CCMP2471" /LENGTH=477 /DNA_ID=CAMNT_0007584235 /DNA_START=20 /DNA_END=1453 /DNA_ORIENTATION=+
MAASVDAASSSEASTAEGEIPCIERNGPVLVTGGAGFIGGAVAEALLRRGETVVVMDEVNDYYDVRIKRQNLMRLTSGWPDKVAVYEGDCSDAEFVAMVFEREGPIKRIVHLAARAGVRPSIQDPFIYIQSNLHATTRLLEYARTAGCDSFVYASSSSVYGESDNEIFSENDMVETPVSPYAATKKMCELISHTYAHLYNVPVTGLRFFTVYGPRGRPDMAPFKFVDRVLRGQEIQQFGDGSSSRDYTFVDDIVDGVIRALDRPSGYKIYNLGNGDPISLKRFIEIVGECTGIDPIVRQLPPQPGDVPRTCADISKARVELGYSPKTPFAQGIQKTVDWFRTEYMVEAANPQDNPEDGPEPDRIAPAADASFPTEEPILRTLPDLPPGLPSEVHSLIGRLHLETSTPDAAEALNNIEAILASNGSSNNLADHGADTSSMTWAPGQQPAANQSPLGSDFFSQPAVGGDGAGRGASASP